MRRAATYASYAGLPPHTATHRACHGAPHAAAQPRSIRYKTIRNVTHSLPLHDRRGACAFLSFVPLLFSRIRLRVMRKVVRVKRLPVSHQSPRKRGDVSLPSADRLHTLMQRPCRYRVDIAAPMQKRWRSQPTAVSQHVSHFFNTDDVSRRSN